MSSEPLRARYEAIVKKLELIASDERFSDLKADNAIFLDDLLLRLKVWAIDVRVKEGSLEWAERLIALKAPLSDRLQDVDLQCTRFESALQQLWQEAIKRGLKSFHC
jgi:hypothetical protein